MIEFALSHPFLTTFIVYCLISAIENCVMWITKGENIWKEDK